MAYFVLIIELGTRCPGGPYESTNGLHHIVGSNGDHGFCNEIADSAIGGVAMLKGSGRKPTSRTRAARRRRSKRPTPEPSRDVWPGFFPLALPAF